MQSPPIPPNEAQRLSDLYEYGILDTQAERVFDEVAELAATICGTRFAAVSLIDAERQWFKAAYGLELRQTPRDESVCAHAIMHREVFEVGDLLADERFADNPRLAGDPSIRFYAGSQLRSERGNALGMLCVLDSKPHQLSEVQRESLRQLADVLMAVIDAGRKTRLLSWFGTLLDNVSDEIFIADPQSLLYLHANQTAQKSLGYSLQEIRSMTPMDLSGEQDRGRFDGYVQRLRAGEPFVEFEGWRKAANGERYPVEIRWQLLSTAGRPVILSVVHDVTERRKIERMKDEFISVVNHELRTPLTSIHGAVKLLEQGAAGPLPPQAVRLVELASQNTDRLRAIVDDILDLDRIASGRMQFLLAPVDAREALLAAASAYEGAARPAGVQLQVGGTAGVRLRADAARLHQVLLNLVSNAVKFAPPGTAVQLHAHARDGQVELSVIDEGPGIPEAFREHIFQRFAQAEMGNSRAKGGSGLGLAIAREMTRQMQGAIEFESVPGRTRFWLQFPQESE